MKPSGRQAQEKIIVIKKSAKLGKKKPFKANRPKKQDGGAILKSNEIDFPPKLIKRERRYFIPIKKKYTKMLSEF